MAAALALPCSVVVVEFDVMPMDGLEMLVGAVTTPFSVVVLVPAALPMAMAVVLPDVPLLPMLTVFVFPDVTAPVLMFVVLLPVEIPREMAPVVPDPPIVIVLVAAPESAKLPPKFTVIAPETVLPRLMVPVVAVPRRRAPDDVEPIVMLPMPHEIVVLNDPELELNTPPFWMKVPLIIALSAPIAAGLLTDTNDPTAGAWK